MDGGENLGEGMGRRSISPSNSVIFYPQPLALSPRSLTHQAWAAKRHQKFSSTNSVVRLLVVEIL